jgi:hypothetical protein
MAFETDFLDLMRQAVTVKHYTDAADSYGQPTFGTSVSVTCRVVQQPKLIRAADGREIVSQGHLWTAGSAGVLVSDELTLPDGTKPKILRVDHFPDEDGVVHHERVWF